VVLSIRCRLQAGENAAIVPVWMGEPSGFTWTTLVRGVMTSAPSASQWQTITRTYALECGAGCKLTPSGPVSGTYFADGSELDITAGYGEVSRIWGLKWWFWPNEVTVECVRGRKQIATRVPEESFGSGNRYDEALLALQRKVKRGTTAHVDDGGRIVLANKGKRKG
jgi:hypothetical protein